MIRAYLAGDRVMIRRRATATYLGRRANVVECTVASAKSVRAQQTCGQAGKRTAHVPNGRDYQRTLLMSRSIREDEGNSIRAFKEERTIN